MAAHNVSAAIDKLLSIVFIKVPLLILRGLFDSLKGLIWMIIEPTLLSREEDIDRLYARYKQKMENARLRRKYRFR